MKNKVASYNRATYRDNQEFVEAELVQDIIWQGDAEVGSTRLFVKVNSTDPHSVFGLAFFRRMPPFVLDKNKCYN